MSKFTKMDGWHQAKGGGYWYHQENPTVGHVLVGCEQCGAIFFERKYKTKGKKGGSGRHFCSQSCASTATVRDQDLSHLAAYRFTKGHKPHNDKGGHRHSAGYWVLNDGSYKALAHRKIMERHLGRMLRKDEVVHHINGNPLDNRIENLQVMTQPEHVKLHWQEGSFKNRESVKEQNIIQKWMRKT